MIYESENYIAENIKYLKELVEKNGHKLVKRNEMIVGHKYYDPYCYVLIYGKKKNDYIKYYPEHYNVTYTIDVTENIMDEKLIVYRVGFNDNDETEVDATCEDEAVELARTIATESGVEFNLDYVESCGYKED